jgi:hypothetical protein
MHWQSKMEGQRVLILVGKHIGEEGVCLGAIDASTRWAVAPDRGTDIIELTFEQEFSLLLNLSSDSSKN